jgi:formylmethanofuran dehydrogenase subunit D
MVEKDASHPLGDDRDASRVVLSSEGEVVAALAAMDGYAKARAHLLAQLGLPASMVTFQARALPASPTLFGYPVRLDPTMETDVIELRSLVESIPVVVRMTDIDAAAPLHPEEPR